MIKAKNLERNNPIENEVDLPPLFVAPFKLESDKYFPENTITKEDFLNMIF